MNPSLVNVHIKRLPTLTVAHIKRTSVISLALSFFIQRIEDSQYYFHSLQKQSTSVLSIVPNLDRELAVYNEAISFYTRGYGWA